MFGTQACQLWTLHALMFKLTCTLYCKAKLQTKKIEEKNFPVIPWMPGYASVYSNIADIPPWTLPGICNFPFNPLTSTAK
jgi:hypothetical protein